MFASCRRPATLFFIPSLAVASGLVLASASGASAVETSPALSAREIASLSEGEAGVEGGFCLLQRESGSIHLRAAAAAAAAAASDSAALEAKADSKAKVDDADKATVKDAKTVVAAEVSAVAEVDAADKATLKDVKTVAAAEVSALTEASDSSTAAPASAASAPASAAGQAAGSSLPEKTAEVAEEPSTIQLEKSSSAAEAAAPAAAASSQKDISAHASEPTVAASKASDSVNAEAEVEVAPPRRWMPLALGILDGSELHYAVEEPWTMQPKKSASAAEAAANSQKDVVALAAEPSEIASKASDAMEAEAEVASPLRWMPLAMGVLDGSELHYAQEVQFSPFSALQLPNGTSANATHAVVRERSKVVLMLIDLCPVCWMTGIDRFYLGSVKLGIAKLAICISTCGLGGLIWGMIDFIAVLANAFSKEDSIDSLGMTAKFSSDQVPAAVWLAVLDILVLIPITIWAMRAGWDYRKASRQAKLDEAASRASA